MLTVEMIPRLFEEINRSAKLKKVTKAYHMALSEADFYYQATFIKLPSQ